ncbi:BPSS1780 family membrane protein [Thauera sp. 27]|uniref:BPSS1780 family membrane protein n=1 Tax=Thauera sp. 27 TaxID=305700 RepID=UPI0022B69618|nr:BPSS1780 family membrane protein [Thauera sp. 27]
MQANRLPMQRGWFWLREGLVLWRRNPALITFATFGYLLSIVVLSLVPLLGQLAASLLMPALSVGVLNACRAIDSGRKVGPDVLFSGFKTNLQSLIAIGGIYLVATLLVLVLVSLVDDGSLFALMRGEAPAEDAGVGFTLLIALTLSTPVVMAYWFAPVLAAWWKVSPAKALFFSFYACLQNWRPFLAYAIGVAIFGAILPGIVIGVLGLLSPALGTLASLPIPLVVIPVIFATFYTATRDVFGLPDAPPVIDRSPQDADDAG